MNNLNFPPICIGTWSWGKGMAGGDMVFGHSLTHQELKPVFDKAMEVGFNLFDTAAIYGMGSSEELLGSFLNEKSNVLVSTKFTPQIASDLLDPMKEMLLGSLQRLHRKTIDLYWIHNPMDVEKWTPYLIPLAKEGLIRRIGASNHNLSEIKRVQEILKPHGLHIDAIQNHYSLLHRDSEKSHILDYCKKEGMTFFSYMVLEEGALTGKYDTNHPFDENTQRGLAYNAQLDKISLLVKEMKEIGLEKGLTVSQVAILWAIAKGTLPIIGVSKVEQVLQAKKALDSSLSLEECHRLENCADQLGLLTLREWEREMV